MKHFQGGKFSGQKAGNRTGTRQGHPGTGIQ
jgi:hypothetical protein